MSNSLSYGNMCVLSRFSCVCLFAILWTVAHHTPPSMEFSRQEYWSGLPFSPPGDLSRHQTHISYVSCIGRWVLYHKRHLGNMLTLRFFLVFIIDIDNIYFLYWLRLKGEIIYSMSINEIFSMSQTWYKVLCIRDE